MLRGRSDRVRAGRKARELVERLESRLLLNGLTVITHGYEPISIFRPGWIDAMGAAVKAIAGPSTSIYALRLDPTDATTVHVSQFARLSGPAQASSSNGETVLLLDWAAVSGVFTQSYSVTYLASVVTPYLTQPDAALGLLHPLAEGSIQMIGHSRGAPLVAEIAQDLGQSGIWVDQVTTLDSVPSPFNNDPAVTLRSNVIFADNYYQTSGDGFFVPNGSRVSGAVNVGPLSLGGAYGSLEGGTHNDVHLFYQGTIDLSSNASDGAHTVPNGWYAASNVSRDATGFYYSRLDGGVRPASGLSSAFGGSAGRASVTRSGVQWPNLGFVTASAMTVAPGQDFTVSFKYQNFSGTSSVQWYLDPDGNPYDGNSIPVGNAANYGSTSDNVANGSVTLNVTAPAGTYFLEGLITNGSATRYAYAAAPVTITAVPSKLAFTQQPTGGIAGAALTPALTVAIEDVNGNIVPTDNSTVTLAIATGPVSGTAGGTLTVQAHHGIATFNNVTLSEVGDYTLQATDGGLTSATSGNITIVPPPPHLAFVHQPPSTIVGVTPAPFIWVAVEDYTGATLDGDSTIVTLSIASGPAGGTMSGVTAVQAQSGVAEFGNIQFSKPGTYTLRAVDGTYTVATSASFTVTLPASKLVFLQQPGNAAAGATLAPAITVAVEDSGGRIVGSDSSTVYLAVFSGPTGTGGAFNGTLAVEAQNGIATFSDLALTRAGGYTLLASDGLLTGARSRGFTISPETSSAHLVLVQASAAAIVGKPLFPPVVVNIQDQYDNLVKSNHSAVTMSVASGPGSVAGTATVNASNGSATFRNATLTMAGTYTLVVTDASLAVPTPVQFVEVVSPGVTTLPAAHVAGAYPFGATAFSTTLKSTAGSSIPFTGSATLSDLDGNLLATTVLTAAGVARFTLPSLTPGTYSCLVSYPGDVNHTAATSSAFTLNIVTAPTTTALQTSAAQLFFGQALTLTASVAANTAPTTVRTGTITFKDGAAVLGQVTLDGNSSAAFTISSPTVGTHSYTAVYSGDSNFKASNSPTRGVSIRKDNTLVTLVPDATAPIAPGGQLLLTATITVVAPGAGMPTGTVIFKDGSKILGTALLDDGGEATLTTSLTTLGTHRLTAVYGGDANSNGSTSAPLFQNVEPISGGPLVLIAPA